MAVPVLPGKFLIRVAPYVFLSDFEIKKDLPLFDELAKLSGLPEDAAARLTSNTEQATVPLIDFDLSAVSLDAATRRGETEPGSALGRGRRRRTQERGERASRRHRRLGHGHGTGQGTGYSGIENPLFYKENTRMFYGDAKKSLDSLLPMIE